MLIASCILLVPFADSTASLVLISSLTLAGIASTTSLNFSLLNDLLPSAGDVGRAVAFIVVGGNLFGVAAPIVTGYVVQATGSYNWAFMIAGILLMAGAVIALTMTRKPMVPATVETEPHLEMSPQRHNVGAVGLVSMEEPHNPMPQLGKDMNLTPLQARVARDIVAYVRQEQLAAGHHVSELGLAKALKTSRTPIKIALNYLAERGMLSQDRNRGFSWPSPMMIWLRLPKICRSPSTTRSISRSR